MFHDPIHFAVFLIICLLLPLLMYTACILQALYNTLKEAYIDVSDIACKLIDDDVTFITFQFILSRGRDESDDDDDELHADVRRISL